MKKYLVPVLAVLALPTAVLTAHTAAAADAKPSSALATMEVAGQQYKVRLTDPAVIEQAERLLRGDNSSESIPHGAIVRSPSPDNPGYSWHIDPADFRFSAVSSIDCDGPPSQVEDRTVGRYGYHCPWGAQVVALDKVTS
ncbi:hypothetical protein [Streptomyces sp. NPDC059918]|uniref:BP74-related protein n=1 Tax=unclassified Streptomyces TaxID=2593676 RepID=UPI00364F28BD